MSEKIYIIPPDRTRYLAEIAEGNAQYNEWVKEQVGYAQKMYQLRGTIDLLNKNKEAKKLEFDTNSLEKLYVHFEEQLHHDCKRLLKEWTPKV